MNFSIKPVPFSEEPNPLVATFAERVECFIGEPKTKLTYELMKALKQEILHSVLRDMKMTDDVIAASFKLLNLMKQVELIIGDEQCTLGVGCEQYGVCYALAHGQPDCCGKNI